MAVLCFDYDGTLSDSLANESVYYIRALHDEGITIINSGEDLRQACRINYFDYCFSHGITMEQLDRAIKRYFNYLEEENIKIPIYEDADVVLKEMQKKHTLYIVSSNDKDFIESRLKDFDIEGIPVFDGESYPSKVQVLESIINKHPDEEIYFIGDTSGDMEEGTKAGIKHLIASTYGWGYVEDIEKFHPEKMVGSVKELFDYLRKI